MRYACLVYYDPLKVFRPNPETAAETEAVLADCETHDRQLQASGILVASEALQLPESAVTVRVRDGNMSVTDGPFMETKEILGGVVLIDARDLNEALRVAAGIPLAKLGAIEVRPVVDFSEPRPQL
jgi:hypothetical protein